MMRSYNFRNPFNHPHFKDWASIIFLSIIWGSSFILMKKGMESYRPEQVACMRIFFSALFLLPFAATRFREVKWEQLKYILAVGIVGSGIPPFLFTYAQTKLDSSVAGILNTLTPVFVLLLGILFFKTTYTFTRIAGIILGFIGSVSLIIFHKKVNNSSEYSYGLLIVATTFLYGLSVNILKTHLQNVRPITITALAFCMIGPFAGSYLFFTNFIEITKTHEGAWSSIGYVGVLAVFGTAISLMIYNHLIQRTTALFASTTTYLIPVVAVLWGFLSGEIISPLHLIGMAVILTGVYLVGKY